MYTVKLQMYDRRKFATEDDIGMSKQVLSNEKCCFLFENYRCCVFDRKEVRKASIGLDIACTKFACNLLSCMLGNLHFSFRRLIPFPILSSSKKNRRNLSVKVTIISLFVLSHGRSFLRKCHGQG